MKRFLRALWRALAESAATHEGLEAAKCDCLRAGGGRS